MVRMPLEVELQRNYKHSVAGARLKLEYSTSNDKSGDDERDDKNSKHNNMGGGEQKASTTTIKRADATVASKEEEEELLPPPKMKDDPASKKKKNKATANESPLPSSSSATEKQPHSLTTTTTISPLELWYHRASKFIASDMNYLTQEAAKSTHEYFDATTLDDRLAEMLQLYLDHQETWQEVCLVIQKPEPSIAAKRGERKGRFSARTPLEEEEVDGELKQPAITLVLNRPMAMKLTESLARLVLFGDAVGPTTTTERNRGDGTRPNLQRFLRAFGSECALYIGGTYVCVWREREMDRRVNLRNE